MKTVRWFACAAAAVTFLVPRAQAQSPVRPRLELELTPFVGRTVFLAELPQRFALRNEVGDPFIVEKGEFEDPGHLGMNVGVRFSQRWAVEAMVSWLPTSLSAENLDERADVDALIYGVTGLFYVPVWGRVGPFLGLGFGAERYDYAVAGTRPDTYLTGNVVGGIAVALRDNLGLRFEARDLVWNVRSGVPDVSAEWENDLMLSTGLSWRIPLTR